MAQAGTLVREGRLVSPGGERGSTGDPGAPGAPGASGQGATIAVGQTITGAAGSPALVENTGTATAAVLRFTIPQGIQGNQGNQGVQGNTGVRGTSWFRGVLPPNPSNPTDPLVNDWYIDTAAWNVYQMNSPGNWANRGNIKGDQGNPGPAATVTVRNTTTLASGSAATVVNAGSSSAAILDFGIPRGAGLPVGAIFAYCSDTAPPGALLCDGSAHSRSTYSELYAVCTTRFGAGDGTTTFNVPDLRSRFLLGSGPGRAVGGVGGEENHQLLPSELASHGHVFNDPTHAHTVPLHGHAMNDPTHNHSLNNPTHQHYAGTYGGYTPGATGFYSAQNSNQVLTSGQTANPSANAAYTGCWVNNQPAFNTTWNGTGCSVAAFGSDAAHNNMPPFVVLAYCIQAI